MDFEAWTVSADGFSATHACGFSLQIEGRPQDPSAVNPGKYPKGLTSIEQVRLLRYGVEAIAKAAKQKSQVRKPSSFSAPANRVKRDTLSLKSRAPEQA